MEIQKYASLCIIALITFIISITQIKFLLKRSLIAIEKETNISYAIWSVCLLIGFHILNFKSITIASEALDMIYKLNISNPWFELFRITTIFIVLTSSCFIVSYFVINYVSIILLGKLKNTAELQNNNFSFFLIKGFLFICLTSCLLVFLDRLLRSFLPILSAPFYH
jgi:hypothetical protein